MRGCSKTGQTPSSCRGRSRTYSTSRSKQIDTWFFGVRRHGYPFGHRWAGPGECLGGGYLREKLFTPRTPPSARVKKSVRSPSHLMGGMPIRWSRQWYEWREPTATKGSKLAKQD